MKLECGCGFSGFTEPVNTTCPACHGPLGLPRMIDFEEYRTILEGVMPKIKHSIVKHGDWSGYTALEVFEKIHGEVGEYISAVGSGTLTGKHGQIDELGDVITTCVKGIRRLRVIMEQAEQ